MTDGASHVIGIVEDIGPVLSGRSAGASLRERVESLAADNCHVVVDFRGVEVATPGFADEIFGKIARALVESGQVSFSNLDEHLRALQDFVTAGRAHSATPAVSPRSRRSRKAPITEESKSMPWQWVEGVVDQTGPHLRLNYRDRGAPVALVSWPKDTTFVVEFLLDEEQDDAPVNEVLRDFRRQLDFYLTEVGSPDPWNYAIYHCGTNANAYSDVHWSYWPEGYTPSRA